MIPFNSFKKHNQLFKEQILSSLERVFDSEWYVLGNEVKGFEKEYSVVTEAKYTVGVASGLDALIIALKALDIKPEDEIIVPSNTYIASWLAVSAVNAKIVPVEPDPRTFNICPESIVQAITKNTKVIMPVHLYGQSSNMVAIMTIAKQYNLFVVEDNAQSQLATWNGKFTGSFGDINATSFYPTKNLGAIGEAGAITTNNNGYRDFVITYRNYGSKEKYINEIKGVNSRIDELQAAILNVKLTYLKEFTRERQLIAQRYHSNLKDLSQIELPFVCNEAEHVYHLFVVKSDKRDELAAFLNRNEIQTGIHYPVPPHLQKAYLDLGYKKGDFPIAEKLSKTILSLPLYPGLSFEEVDFVCDKIKSFYK
jgi:dTDP-4-amino-4,6-dideoxygalactose transaminase